MYLSSLPSDQFKLGAKMMSDQNWIHGYTNSNSKYTTIKMQYWGVQLLRLYMIWKQLFIQNNI